MAERCRPPVPVRRTAGSPDRPPPGPPPPSGPTHLAGPTTSVRLAPITSSQREPILDVLRGFALMGILLVNIEYMRSSAIFGAQFGLPAQTARTPADELTSFLVGWLVRGKFAAAFSIMFGIGAALIARRALDAGRSPAGLLARRYGWLLGFGLAHMLLLFPGDVLFVYGVTGLLLLAFVTAPPRMLARWSLALLAGTTLVYTLLAVAVVAGGPAAMDAGAGGPFAEFAVGQQQRAGEVYADGSYGQLIGVNAFLSLVIQSGQLSLLPWFLALFLFGFAVGRSGLVHDLRRRRTLLRRSAVLGLTVGLPINLVMGPLGPLGSGTAAAPPWVRVAGVAVQIGGAPVLTVGYLATLALICLRWRPFGPLAAAGRMALSAYLLQSVLALLAFWGFGLYDGLGAAEALVVVAGIWVVVLVVSMLWMSRFRFGPAEWLWRTLTYGRRQPLRR